MTRLSEMMTPSVKAVDAASTLKELAEFLIEEDVSGAPVTSSGKLVGVVSVTDLIGFDAEDRGVPTYETVRGADDASGEWTEPDRSPPFFSDPWEEDRVPLQARLMQGSAD